jgi:hypothetical protein
LNEELAHIRNVLYHNGYPKNIIEKRMKHTICKEKEKQRQKPQITNNTLNNQNLTKNDDRISLVLSYIGHESFIFSRKLMRILRSTKLNTRIIFKKHKTIGQQFRDKMKGQNSKKIGVVYCIDCKDCEKIYVGQTGKDIQTRMQQHEEKCRSSEEQSSSILKHSRLMNHRFNFDEPSKMHVMQTSSEFYF